MNFEDWKKQNDMEVAILDQVIGLLVKFRDAAAIQSYPGGLGDLGIRKKQPFDNWVAGAGSHGTTAIYRGPRIEVPTKFEPGIEECGK